MRAILLLVAASVLLLLLPHGSVIAKNSSIGIYAIIDQVTLEPDNVSPRFARISGVFVVPASMSSGSYQKPQKGLLYFRIAPGQENATRKDWEELKSTAGSDKVVTFGQYWVPNPRDSQGNPHHSLEVRVRTEGEVGNPDVYPIPQPGGVVPVEALANDAGNDPEAGEIASQLICYHLLRHPCGRNAYRYSH